MEIPVTQYIKPRGRTKVLRIEIPDECKAMVEKIASLHLHFTCEALHRGMVAQYISHKEGDFAIVLSSVDASHDQIVKMINDFDEEAFKEWLVGMTEDEEGNNGG